MMIDVLPVPSSPMTRILYRCSFFSPPPACEHTCNIARSVFLPPSCTGLKQVLPLTQYCTFSLVSLLVQVLNRCSLFSPQPACEQTKHCTFSLVSHLVLVLNRCSIFSPQPACEQTKHCTFSLVSHLVLVLNRCSIFSPPPACEHTCNIARSVLLPILYRSCIGAPSSLPLRPVNTQYIARQVLPLPTHRQDLVQVLFPLSPYGL